MTIKISPEILKELEYIVKLHLKYGAPNPMESVEDLIGYILSSVADGSRRPGSWERQMIEQMGLVADSDEHQIYRNKYGEPEPE